MDVSAPGSPLSDFTNVSSASDPFEEESQRLGSPPPAKRQKKAAGNDYRHESPSPQAAELAFGDVSISSDSSGDIPARASTIKFDDDDPEQEQVTTCQWAECDAGDLGNRDVLVSHIHASHIDNKAKNKYTCEWAACNRKGSAHASAYALKGHMRGHTREKSFQCGLPECDRTFTRADALFKHMRSVHESEVWKTTDLVPKSMQHLGQGHFRHLQAMENPGRESSGAVQVNGASGLDHDDWTTAGFTTEEEKLGPKELYRRLRRQVHWAEEQTKFLTARCDDIEAMRKREWLEKEQLFEQVIRSEKAYQTLRRSVLADLASKTEQAGVVPKLEGSQGDTSMQDAAEGELVGEPLEQTRSGDQREAAAALISLHQL